MLRCVCGVGRCRQASWSSSPGQSEECCGGDDADFYEEEVDVAVAALTSLLEPLLMVVVGAVVGVVLISMYLPIFDLAGKIKAE